MDVATKQIASTSTSDISMVTRRAQYDRRMQMERLKARKMTGASASADHESSSFTFRALRPFHPERIAAALRDEHASGLQSLNGIAWIACRDREQVLLSYSSAASALVAERGPPWWICVPEDEWPDGLAEELRPLWNGDFGDRQVELAVQTKSASARGVIEATLKYCLLTDAELQLGADEWAKMRDPWEEARLRQPFSFVPRPTSPSKVAAQPNDAAEYGECAPCK